MVKYPQDPLKKIQHSTALSILRRQFDHRHKPAHWDRNVKSWGLISGKSLKKSKENKPRRGGDNIQRRGPGFGQLGSSSASARGLVRVDRCREPERQVVVPGREDRDGNRAGMGNDLLSPSPLRRGGGGVRDFPLRGVPHTHPVLHTYPISHQMLLSISKLL
ncbi:hypothetical protein L484_018271 [Morus notabilis]|uniref:Uncharacterized protein n=1 Tax=Morus notabilis TaxID=981085 RepID=W9SAN1_9ROSA|nr:hypothetical protein L484_018271 [Morus notabilis]